MLSFNEFLNEEKKEEDKKKKKLDGTTDSVKEKGEETVDTEPEIYNKAGGRPIAQGY